MAFITLDGGGVGGEGGGEAKGRRLHGKISFYVLEYFASFLCG